MTTSNAEADAEAWVLTTVEGRALLDAVAPVLVPGPADLVRWRKSAAAEHVSAAVRMTRARRRGAAKFTRADRMWFEATGLEQATAEPVARHKAERFAARSVVDLCCGIGGDALALSQTGDVLAVDADHANARRTLWNARVYDADDRVAVVQARAESFSIPRGTWVHIDPDRRAGDRRARAIDGYQPGPEFLRRLIRSTPAGALKLGPASDFEAHFGGPGLEIELVSLGGECKEATVWYGEAATCRRRASRLPEATTWTDRDGPDGVIVPVGPVLGHVFDPDPSLLRAGLLDAFAAVHGLTRLASGVDYLTGPNLVSTPFLSAFAVLAVLPLDLKRLRREVAARGLGPIEIKTRGVSLTPEAVRARLRAAPGGPPAVVLLSGGHGPARAVLARRVGRHDGLERPGPPVQSV